MENPVQDEQENAEKQGKVHGNDDDDRHIEEGSIPFLSTNATQPKELKPDAGSPVECNEVEEESSSVTDNGSENDAGSHSSDNEILERKFAVKKNKLYTCFYCEFSVEKMKYMKSHIKRFHSVNSSCLNVDKSAETNIELELQSPAETNEPPATSVPTPELSSNPSQNNKKKFDMDLCPYCDFSDKNEKKLRHHILTKHSKELDKIIVYTCEKNEPPSPPKKVHKLNESAKAENRVPKSFNAETRKNNFAQNKNRSYSVTKIKQETSDNNQNDIIPIRPDVEGSFSDYTSSKDGVLRCPQCDFCSGQAWELMLHMSESHGEGGHSALSKHPTLGEMVEELVGGGLKVAAKLYCCDHCSYTTPRLQLLNRHLLSKHSDRKPHQCHECDYATKRMEHLNRHILSKHSGQKPFPCHYCDYRASRDDHLRNHVMSKHAGEQMLRCVHCGYAALSAEHLNIHVLTKHSELQPFMCQKCPFAGPTESDLTQHMRTVHSEERPFSCDYCEFSTATSDEMDRHALASHPEKRPFRCTVCDYSSARSEHLNFHVQSKHIGERPHVCPDCDYRATRLSHLTRHIQSKHSGLKPFLCSQCNYRAARMEHLHRHIITRHSDAQSSAETSLSCHGCEFTATTSEQLNHHIICTHVEGAMYGQLCDVDIKTEIVEDEDTVTGLKQDQVF